MAQAVKGFVKRGWRCGCGNEHSNPEDVDNIVKYFKALKKGVEATVFKSGNSISVRLPKVIADLYHLNTNNLKPDLVICWMQSRMA